MNGLRQITDTDDDQFDEDKKIDMSAYLKVEIFE